MIMNDGSREYIFNPGEFRFGRRNHLVKFNKLPPEGGEFRSFSVHFDQPFLRNFSMEAGFKVEKHIGGNAVTGLKPDPLYKNYFDSLPPYMQLNGDDDAGLIALKLREAVLLLLKVNPEMKDILFDFSEPGKIDLEAFMNKNFHFNVDLGRFAYLTGRSLATFKRDFEKLFHLTPSRWLQQRRLQEAYYLIREKGKTASDIYLDLGFEDLSHFSFAFKKQFGAAPTKI
jgi:AraC-like DNA-binding protein